MEKVAAGGRKSYGVSGGGANGDYDCFCFFPTGRRRRRLCGASLNRTIDFCTLYSHVWGIKPVPEYEARRTEQLEKQCVIQYGTGVQLYPDRSTSRSTWQCSLNFCRGTGRYRIICRNLYVADGVEYAGSAAVFAQDSYSVSKKDSVRISFFGWSV